MPMPKLQPTGPLEEMIGKRKRPRTKITADIWKYIDKYDLKAEGKPGAKKIRVNNRLVYPGQVVHSGDDEIFEDFAHGKKKISMFDIAGLVSDWTE